MVLFLILAFIQFGSPGLPGEGEDVFIGQALSGVELDNSQESQLQAEEVKQDSESEIMAEELEEIKPLTDASDNAAISDQLAPAPSPSGGGRDFAAGLVVSLTGGSGSGNWKCLPE